LSLFVIRSNQTQTKYDTSGLAAAILDLSLPVSSDSIVGITVELL